MSFSALTTSQKRWNWLVNGGGPFHLQLPETLIISSARMSLSIYPPLSHSPSLLPSTSTMLPAKTRQLYAGVIPEKLQRDLPSFSKHFFPLRFSPCFSSLQTRLLYTYIWISKHVITQCSVNPQKLCNRKSIVMYRIWVWIILSTISSVLR